MKRVTCSNGQKRFLGDDNVRFTWLLTPRSSEEGAAWMPYAVLGVAFASTVGMMAVLGREGIGPLSQFFRCRFGTIETTGFCTDEAKP